MEQDGKRVLIVTYADWLAATNDVAGKWIDIDAVGMNDVHMAEQDPDDGEGDVVIHPAILLMQEGHVLEDADVVHSWRDDHAPCFVVKLVVAGESYVMSILWTMPEVLFSMGRAIGNAERSREFANSLVSS